MKNRLVPLRRLRDHERTDVACPCMEHCLGTGQKRGPGRAYVIDDQHSTRPNELRTRGFERPRDVGQSCGAVEGDLRLCIHVTGQATWKEPGAQVFGDRTRKQRRRIEAALHQTTRVERHGDHDVRRFTGHHSPSAAQRGRKRARHIRATLKLQPDDRLSDGPPINKSSDVLPVARLG
jgi:hypothetical protein